MSKVTFSKDVLRGWSNVKVLTALATLGGSQPPGIPVPRIQHPLLVSLGICMYVMYINSYNQIHIHTNNINKQLFKQEQLNRYEESWV